MGATDFRVAVYGTDLKTAFNAAVEEAAWEYGHGGYTGTIAEKMNVVLVRPEMFETRAEADAFVDRLLDAEDERIFDKWGPAGAVSYRSLHGETFAGADPTDPEFRYWLFFGMAPC